MSNSYFRFKQFTVHQDCCAMKVSTDACIQGAWTPVPEGPLRVLDVGAGTGLLSLMIAQRNRLATIDAIELDEDAAMQAASNVRDSRPFANQITVHHADARSFDAKLKYDLIICNPPFFKDSLLGPDSNRNAARHNLHLQHQDLISLMDRSLMQSGRMSIMLPVPEMHAWQVKAEEAGWLDCGSLYCQDTAGTRVHRLIGMYGRSHTPATSDILVIKKSDGDYDDYFKTLLSPFYLHL